MRLNLHRRVLPNRPVAQMLEIVQCIIDHAMAQGAHCRPVLGIQGFFLRYWFRLRCVGVHARHDNPTSVLARREKTAVFKSAAES